MGIVKWRCKNGKEEGKPHDRQGGCEVSAGEPVHSGQDRETGWIGAVPHSRGTPQVQPQDVEPIPQ